MRVIALQFLFFSLWDCLGDQRELFHSDFCNGNFGGCKHYRDCNSVKLCKMKIIQNYVQEGRESKNNGVDSLEVNPLSRDQSNKVGK